MKNYLNKIVFALIIGIGITMTSCKKDNPTPEPNQHNDAFGDVFVKKVKTQQGDKYGLTFYAGGQGLTACKAKAPDGTEYTLSEYWKGAGNMRRHPANNEMQTAIPQAGDYTFTMTFDDGETKTITDALSADDIPSIKQVRVAHARGTEDVNINWSKVDGADNYMIKLTDKYKNEHKPIFVNKTITAADTAYSFNKSTTATPGWMQTGKPVAGDTCYVMVVAVKYEDGVSGAAKDQNRQMVTVKPSMIIW
jgi:quinol monooxygenase YgiN